MGSLEREYKGNKLNFGKTFVIDSGKGSNYTGYIAIKDSGKPMPARLTEGISNLIKNIFNFLLLVLKHWTIK